MFRIGKPRLSRALADSIGGFLRKVSVESHPTTSLIISSASDPAAIVSERGDSGITEHENTSPTQSADCLTASPGASVAELALTALEVSSVSGPSGEGRRSPGAPSSLGAVPVGTRYVPSYGVC